MERKREKQNQNLKGDLNTKLETAKNLIENQENLM